VNEMCAKARHEARQQETDEINKAKASGVTFFQLSDADMATLRKQGDVAHKKYADEINKNYPGDMYKPNNFLKEVEDFLGYKP